MEIVGGRHGGNADVGTISPRKKGRPVAGRLPRQGVAPIAKKAGPETIWVAAVVIAAGDILDVERVVGSSASGGTRENPARDLQMHSSI